MALCENQMTTERWAQSSFEHAWEVSAAERLAIGTHTHVMMQHQYQLQHKHHQYQLQHQNCWPLNHLQLQCGPLAWEVSEAAG